MDDRELHFKSYELYVEFEKKMVDWILTINYYYYTFVAASIYWVYSQYPTNKSIVWYLSPHLLISIALIIAIFWKFLESIKYLEEEMFSCYQFLFGGLILKDSEKESYNKLLGSQEYFNACQEKRVNLIKTLLGRDICYVYMTTRASCTLIIVTAICMLITSIFISSLLFCPSLQKLLLNHS